MLPQIVKSSNLKTNLEQNEDSREQTMERGEKIRGTYKECMRKNGEGGYQKLNTMQFMLSY
uniref:Uncharacterized protein n=1 Tax=Arundo donax TaxID=35708 RepID=A0A0A9B810_ARUDO